MDKTIFDQITNLLEKSQKILVLTHAKADCDGLGAAISAYLTFKTLGKDVTVATNDPVQENLLFLPGMDTVKNSLAGTKDFIITIDSSKSQIDKIKYNVDGDKVNIIITPKDGSFSQGDVSFSQGSQQFDLVFVLDAGNLEHLGALYDQNVEVFYNTPVINMDHHASNTDFGQVNAVDVTAASATEILFEYLQYLENRYGKKLITEDVATLLLAGIITDTGSFQHANTSPRAMETSARLLDLGARQQEVIKNIFKTKKLSTLKLWGSILSKVQVDPVHRMVWSVINHDDLIESEADPGESEGIIDDLLTNAPGAEVIFLIKENPEYVSVSMRSTNNQTDVGKFCADNGGGGHARAAGFKIYEPNKPLDLIVSDVINKVRAFQAARLNIHEEPKSQPDKINLPSQPQKPVNTPIGATNGTPTGTKVTYLDFQGVKKEEKQTAEQPVKQPEIAPEVKAETQPKTAMPAVQKPATQTDKAPVMSASKKRRLRRKKKLTTAVQPSATTPAAAVPAVKPAEQTQPATEQTDQPKKETPPDAPFVEPV